MILVFKIDDKIFPKKNISKKYNDYLQEYINFFILNENKWYNSKTLCNNWNVINSAEIRKIINHLRIELNISIISSKKGYKYTQNKKEIKNYKRNLNYRAFTMLSASKNIK